MTGKRESMLFEGPGSSWCSQHPHLRCERGDVVPGPRVFEDRMLPAQLVGQLVQGRAGMAGPVCPKLAGEAFDFMLPILDQRREVRVGEEDPQQVRPFTCVVEHGEQLRLGLVPSNEVPVLVEDVRGVGIETVEETSTGRVEGGVGGVGGKVNGSERKQVLSFGSTETQCGGQAGEHVGRHPVCLALLEAGEPGDAHACEHGDLLTPQPGCSAMAGGRQSDVGRVEAFPPGPEEGSQFGRFHAVEGRRANGICSYHWWYHHRWGLLRQTPKCEGDHMSTRTVHPSHLLSRQAQTASSSAIRDLLRHAKRPGMISLAGGLPDALRFPLREMASIAEAAVRLDGRQTLQYGLSRGEDATRLAAANVLFDDRPDPDDLVATTGSQQALDLLGRVLIDPGDVIVCSDPDYVGSLQIFRSHRADLHAIRTTPTGFDTVALEADLRRGLRPKACYVVPHFHNPSGTCMPRDAREHLAELSSHYGFVLVEDDPYRELHYDGSGPTEAVLDPELHIRLRSVSKTLAPGLRVGVMAAPSWIREAIVAAKQSTDLHTSTLTQAIAAACLDAPWYPEHLASLRVDHGIRRDVLCSALQREFGDRVRFTRPTGGMFVWVDALDGVDSTELLGRALEENVCFVPGSAFAVDRDLSMALRLNFTNANEEDLREGVARLGRAQARVHR